MVSNPCMPPPPCPHRRRRCGFEEVPRSQVPAFLQLEYTVGLALAWLVTRDRLVLMRLAAGGSGGGGTGQQQPEAEGLEREG